VNKKLLFLALAFGLSTPVCLVAQTVDQLRAQLVSRNAAATTVAAAHAASAKALREGATAMAGGLDEIAQRPLLAMTTPEYPVTPGDVYELAFITSGGIVTTSLIVDADYRVDLANLGSLVARGMLLSELRDLVERKVLAAYPLSAPRLAVKSCGSFPVYIRGEVARAEARYCWGLTRLSELWTGTTAWASCRSVLVRPKAGGEKSYDLFRVWREGDLSQDPYLRPFDTVRFERRPRSVSLGGSVRRPGSYQLLPGEGIRELIEVYGDGFTPDANRAWLELLRAEPGSSGIGEKRKLEWESAASFELKDLDAVTVYPLRELLPVAYFEGALGLGAEGAQLEAANRVPYTFYPGEKLSQAARNLRGQFSAVSDLERAYLLRKLERIPINLESFLYDKDFTKDLDLAAGDVIVVPFRQFFVSVAGAVKVPGRYPYVPDRGWEYYINLAGGFDRDRNSKSTIDIMDAGGKRWGKDRMIEPEDTIVAAANSFYYYLGKVAPVVATVASVITIIANAYTLSK